MTTPDPAGKLGIEINFLTGRYVATSHNDRLKSEWPPHTARLYSTLVSVWAEGGHDKKERDVLEWLETQSPPVIAASDATWRKVVTHFVPVADVSIIGLPFHEKKAKTVWDIQDRLDKEMAISKGADVAAVAQLQKKLSEARDVKSQIERAGKTNPLKAAQLFPERRPKQERFFPSVTPYAPRVTYVWNSAPPDGLDLVLDGLLGRVVRLGHPSSLVSCRMVRDPPAANHLPSKVGATIRSIRRGQLEALEHMYEAHQGIRPRSLPFENILYSATQGIADAAPVKSNMAGEWIVFEFAPDSRMLLSTRTVEVAQAMRSAIMCHASDPIPEGISGHGPGGKPTTLPHMALMPLPNARSKYADGRLLGLALSLPDMLDDSTRRAALRAIGNWEGKPGGNLTLGLKSGPTIRLSRQRRPSTLKSLQYDTWSEQSVRWVTTIPMALPKHPGGLGVGDAASRAKAWEAAESAVTDACTHVGLPKPASVDVSLSPYVNGAHHIRRFPPFSQNGLGGNKIRRQLVHALVEFGSPVKGPLALGAGRFAGLGLMISSNTKSVQKSGDLQ